jgi:nitroimidazol reductase NimA-like FMN-containing flavoprotein (pyridoxamine 5'-phosphate oxidase superfamily)
MTTMNQPHFRDLSTDEARSLLARLTVGRVAFTLHDRVDIEPINYASDGDWIYGRTGAGMKLTTLLHNPWCALEADEVRGPLDWESVVAKGTFYLLDPETGSPGAYDRAVARLREILPGTFSEGDPVPQRDIIFGIYVNEISGREARS